MRAYRLHDASWTRIITHRVRRPEMVGMRLSTRRRPDQLVPADGQLVLLQGNHRIDPRSGEPVDRRELLDRLVEALSVSEIDGIVASADLLEELTVLNVLEHRLAVCSVVASSPPAPELSQLASSNFDGASLSYPLSVAGSQVSRDLAQLAAHHLPAMLDLIVDSAGRGDFDTPWFEWVDQLHSATSSIGTGSGVWITLPAISGLKRLAEATGFPVLIRDTDVPISPSAWERFFQAELPVSIRGMLAGSTALFPIEGTVAESTSRMARAVRARYNPAAA